MSGDEEFRPVNHRCWDIEQRVVDMNTDDIDVQIISNTPILFQYHRPLAQVYLESDTPNCNRFNVVYSNF